MFGCQQPISWKSFHPHGELVVFAHFMKKPTNIEHSVKKIQCISELEDANSMLKRGWIYLGYYKARVVQVLGQEPEDVPVFVLGKVE